MVAASTHRLILVSILPDMSDLAELRSNDPIDTHNRNIPVEMRSEILPSFTTLANRK